MLKWPPSSSGCGQCFRLLIRSYFSTLSSTVAAAKNEKPIMVEYLVKSLGFSEKAASLTSSKVRPMNSTRKPEKVVKYLKSSGFNEAQIRTLVNLHPRVLFNDVDKTLKPKVTVFLDIGVSGSDVRAALSSKPFVLLRGLKTQIMPALKLLNAFLSSPENVFTVLLNSQRILSCNSRRYFTRNVSLLQSYGVSKLKIEKRMIEGNTFLWNPPKLFENAVRRVEEELRIPRSSPMFLHGVCALSSISKEKVESKAELFQSLGWSKMQFYEMIRRLPYMLKTSESLIRVRLKYFMGELGYGSDYLATHPVLLASSEKRVKPRNHVLQVLMEKQLLKRECSLYSFVLAKESVFLEKFVMPFKKEVPTLYQDYIAMTSKS